MSIYTYTHTNTCVSAYTYPYIHINVHINVQTHVHAQVTCAYTHAYTCIHIQTHVHVHLHIHIHILIHALRLRHMHIRAHEHMHVILHIRTSVQGLHALLETRTPHWLLQAQQGSRNSFQETNPHVRSQHWMRSLGNSHLSPVPRPGSPPSPGVWDFGYLVQSRRAGILMQPHMFHVRSLGTFKY